MSVFNTAKSEIKEMVNLAQYIERFDREVMLVNGIKPTKDSMNFRNKSEIRYAELLKKYTQ